MADNEMNCRYLEADAATEANVPQAWAIGDVILGTYMVRQVHEGGGMGLVYRVHHQDWNMDLAVKSPRLKYFETERQKQNFVRECETWINLGLHPHIASCFYVRTLGGIPRVFAEYVKGGSLRDWIQSRRLYEGGPEKALKRILNIAIQMAWGLHYAHEQGVIHQDVKPANVLMAPDGAAKITDFGLARARAATTEAESSHPNRSIVVSTGGMTPAYCSPEQASRHPVTRRTDVWSWGVSLLEMFAGDILWLNGSVAPHVLTEMAASASHDDSLPYMPDDLCRLLQDCFVTDPAARLGDLRDVSKQLLRIYHSCTGKGYARTEPSAVELRAGGLNNRALSFREIGQEEEAVTSWAQAEQIDPIHPETVYNHGLYQWRSAEIMDDELVRRLKGLCAAHADDWRTKYFLAQIHLERCDYDAAKSLLAKMPAEFAARKEADVLTRIASDSSHDTRKLHTLSGKTDWVSSIALNSDGNLALSASYGRKIKNHGLYLWDLRSAECVREMTGHSGGVRTVDLSKDGRVGLSGGEDGVVRLWDVENGKCLRSFTGHTDVVSTVCLSVEGRLAVTGSWDHSLRIWDMDSGRCRRVLEGHEGRIFSARVSAQGDFVASAGGTEKDGDYSIRIWSLSSGRCLRVLSGHTKLVSTVSLTADGGMLLSGSNDLTLRLWNVTTGRCIRVFTGHIRPVDAACITPDGRRVLSSDNSALLVWDVSTGRCIRHLAVSEEGCPKTIQFAEDGHLAVSGGFDRKLTVWHIGSLQYRAPFALSRVMPISKAATDAVRCAAEMRSAREAIRIKDAQSALSHLIAARSVSGFERSPDILKLWQSLYTWLPRTTLHDAWEEGRITSSNRHAFVSLDMTSDGRIAISCGGFKSGMVSLWDLSSRRCLREFDCDMGSSVCLSEYGRIALAGGFNLHLLHIAKGRILRLDGHAGDVSAVSISPDSRVGIAGHYDGMAELWDLKARTPIRLLCGHKENINAVCFNSDGRLAVTGSGDWANGPKDATVRIWDIASGACMRTFEAYDGAIMTVRVTPDDQYVLSGSSGGTIQLWDLQSGNRVRTFEGHDGSVNTLCVTSDGRYVLSGGDDGEIRVWEFSTGTCARVLGMHGSSVTCLCLSADARVVVSSHNDGSLRRWAMVWNLEQKEQKDWHEDARPFLKRFLILHTPRATQPKYKQMRDSESLAPLPSSLQRAQPRWTETGFQHLISTLECAGFGWLRRESIRNELESMARDWNGPPALF